MRLVGAGDAAVVRAGLAEVLADNGHEVGAALGDAEVATGMLDATRHAGALPELTAREHDVLMLMAGAAAAAPPPSSP
jgi:hypothetical protein